MIVPNLTKLIQKLFFPPHTTMLSILSKTGAMGRQGTETTLKNNINLKRDKRKPPFHFRLEKFHPTALSCGGVTASGYPTLFLSPDIQHHATSWATSY